MLELIPQTLFFLERASANTEGGSGYPRLCQRTIKPNVQMSLDDYAVSSNVGFIWAFRLSQVLAFTECPIDSQAEESLK